MNLEEKKMVLVLYVCQKFNFVQLNDGHNDDDDDDDGNGDDHGWDDDDHDDASPSGICPSCQPG